MIDINNINKSNDSRRVNIEGRVLVAHQPEFMPWLGNISKATMGDVYLIIDHVQFVKQHWQSRNKIRISGDQGWQWLTVPLKDVHKHLMTTDKVRIDGDFWKKKHLKSIKQAYQKTPYFDMIFNEINNIYAKEHIFIIDFLTELMSFAFKTFDISVPVYKTTDLIKLGYSIKGTKSELLVNMCKSVGAETFVFGKDGQNYIDKSVFIENNIGFVFQDYEHPIYTQAHGDFISHMSFLDLLFNYGPNAIQILGKSNYIEL